MNNVEQAKKQIRDLEDMKDNILGRSKALFQQHQGVSHAAFTGNTKALRRLRSHRLLRRRFTPHTQPLGVW
jgi:hypothetical protein